MKSTLYITLEQVLVIHEDQVDRYGGSSGIRDIGLIESAVARPQAGFGIEEFYKTIFQKAAALIHSLLKNHAFVDANKRTATASVLVFLQLNEITITAEQNELVAFAMSVENNDLSLDDIANWLEKHSKKTE